MEAKKIIVAIDEHDKNSFEKIINCLNPNMCMVKIGSVSFNSLGRECVIYAASMGFGIFLDLKLHDIPNTVKKSIEGLVNLPIQMMTVHVSGGLKMLEESVGVAKDKNIKIFGVTALTSLNDHETNIIYKRNADEQVMAMLEVAKNSNINGIVCSPHELHLVKANSNLLVVTPGIRLKDLGDDQSRVMTPIEAIKNGSDFLVIGRPITKSKDISKSLNQIYETIQQ